MSCPKSRERIQGMKDLFFSEEGTEKECVLTFFYQIPTSLSKVRELRMKLDYKEVLYCLPKDPYPVAFFLTLRHKGLLFFLQLALLQEMNQFQCLGVPHSLLRRESAYSNTNEIDSSNQGESSLALALYRALPLP